MKYVLMYWILGCLIMGTVYKHKLEKNPDLKVEEADVIRQVAIWPALYIAAGALPENKDK